MKNKKSNSIVRDRQAQAVEMVNMLTRSFKTPVVKKPIVNEVYNATSSVMEITDGKGYSVMVLEPYERREIDGEMRDKLEMLEHFRALVKRDRVRFF